MQESDADETFEQSLADFLREEVDAAGFVKELLNSVPALVSAFDRQGRVLFSSPEHRLLSGVANEPEAITTLDQLFPDFINERFQPSLLAAIFDNSLDHWELSVKQKTGRIHLYDIKHKRVYSPKRNDDIVITFGSDITGLRINEDNALKEHKSQAGYLSFHDPLTGLANRSLFYDRVHKSIARVKRSKSSLALLLLDLDRFKNINDSLGHDAGDFFLKQVAKRINDALRDTDTVARLGGDEFVIVLESIAKAHDISIISSKILESIAQPLNVQGHEISCTASIGVSLFPKDGASIDQLLRHADLAMAKAKALGKNRAQFFVKAMTDNAVNYLLLENDLRKAIDAHDLRLYYQPQVDLRTGMISGLEALVRWQHRERGVISPGEFIPLAEETGLIEPLGDWVIYEACERFQHWLSLGMDFGKIAVNLSPRQFRQEHFDQSIIKSLLRTQLPPEYLELEITETSAMENAGETIELLGTFSEMGLSLAIDDFGTGYSSLAYLKRFPLDKLKIDRSFINDIDTDDTDAAIAKSIIDLAHNMSLKVIAEGVERASQSRWLIDRGCDEVQGFYYARPLSEAALITLVQDKSRAIISPEGVRLLLR